jgi:riboflavin kinase/FMN adenylyltransferase
VIHGEGRGNQIGFPTANLQLSGPYMLPRLGVYVVKVKSPQFTRYGVMNIGVKPTFHDDLKIPTLEVHLLNYHGNLYGTELEIEFIEYLRKEKKFESVQQLIEQIQADKEKAHKLVAELHPVDKEPFQEDEVPK